MLITLAYDIKRKRGDRQMSLPDIRLASPLIYHKETTYGLSEGGNSISTQRVLVNDYPKPNDVEEGQRHVSFSSTTPTTTPLVQYGTVESLPTLQTVIKHQNLIKTGDSQVSVTSKVLVPSLISNAHTLPPNDAFLPHFAALHQVPNLTVSDAMLCCQFTEKELGHFQYNGDASWRVNLTPDLFIALQRESWQSFIQHDLVPWASISSRFSGRGIIVVAGHQKSIKRLKVSLRVLLELGCTLPVEVHYYDDEMDEATRQDLLALYDQAKTRSTRLFLNDLASSDQVLNSSYNRKYHVSYQLKTAAMTNSRFVESLLLDSDNILAIDPSELWLSRTYQEYGSVFWPDFPRTRPEHPAWAITNTPCRREEYEFESGQLIVDKRRFFYHLQLAAWWNEQGYCNDLLLGDKDTFRFAWHALRTDFGTPKKWFTSVGFVAEQEDEAGQEGQTRLGYCGHTFAQHHPDFGNAVGSSSSMGSGIAFYHGGTLKTLSAPLMIRLKENKGGIFTHYKRSDIDEEWSEIEYDVGLRYWQVGFYSSKTPEPTLNGREDFGKDNEPTE